MSYECQIELRASQVSNFEQAISLLEARCHENLQKAMRAGATSAGVQQGHVDASSYCDVCMSVS